MLVDCILMLRDKILTYNKKRSNFDWNASKMSIESRPANSIIDDHLGDHQSDFPQTTHVALPPALRTGMTRLGLPSPFHALLCVPARYQDCRRIFQSFMDIETQRGDVDPPVIPIEVTLRRYKDDLPSMRGFSRESKIPLKSPWMKNCSRLEIDVEDGNGQTAILQIFGKVMNWRNSKAGERLIVVAQPKRFGTGDNEKLYLNRVEKMSMAAIDRVMPVYTGLAGRVAGETVAGLIDFALMNGLDQSRKAAADAIRDACGLDDEDILSACDPDRVFLNLDDLLAGLHVPHTPEIGLFAIKVAGRVSSLGVQASAQRQNARAFHPDASIGGADGASEILDMLPNLIATQSEKLTQDQLTVAYGIARSLQESIPLNGLLSGDVGTGKTLAFLLPAVAVCQLGKAVAIMAPTDLLADQIAENIQRRFGQMVTVERVMAGKKIRDSKAILVGTPGLSSVAVKHGYKPNLLIVDEQHKSNPKMRQAMVGPWTHVLEVSATPIPRSLALSLHAGMETFSLRQVPVEKKIVTELVDVAGRGATTLAIRNALARGQRAAIVFPRVESTNKSDSLEVSDVESTPNPSVLYAATLFEQSFPGRVAVLHGKMTNEEKQNEIRLVRSGQKPLVIASTVFETGIDIPDVMVMIVRDADRFGLSQLHQIRGRLARAGGEGKCFLMVDDLEKLSSDTRERLDIMTKTNDGYDLSEQDMLMRGAGELEGEAQSGNTDTVFKLVRMRTEELLQVQATLEVDAIPQVERSTLISCQERLFG